MQHQQKWEPARVCVAGTLVDVAGCWSIFWSRDICPKNRFVRVVGLFIGPLSLSHFTKPWMSKPWRVTDIVISLWLSLTNLFIHWTLWTDDINGSFNDMISRQTNYHLIYKLQTTNMIWYDMIRFVWFDYEIVHWYDITDWYHHITLADPVGLLPLWPNWWWDLRLGHRVSQQERRWRRGRKGDKWWQSWVWGARSIEFVVGVLSIRHSTQTQAVVEPV